MDWEKPRESRGKRRVSQPKDQENWFGDKAGQTRFSTKQYWGVNFELYFGLPGAIRAGLSSPSMCETFLDDKQNICFVKAGQKCQPSSDTQQTNLSLTLFEVFFIQRILALPFTNFIILCQMTY
jgi:hypothetical protein